MRKRRTLASACGTIYLKFFTQRRKEREDAKGKKGFLYVGLSFYYQDSSYLL